MHKVFSVYCCFLLTMCSALSIAQNITGTIFDKATRQPLPFATIKFSDAGKGTIADLNGVFKIGDEHALKLEWVEISCLGYDPIRLKVPLKSNTIFLQPIDNTLTEVVIKPPLDKIRRILNLAISNKPQNNPDRNDWYRCRVYYKMVVDLLAPVTQIDDTDKERNALRAFLQHQHLMMSETYSIRSWEQPQHLQEDIRGTRISGLKKSMFTGLVTDVLPFHAYTDYLSLNGTDYHNPLSKGFEQYYKFSLIDELQQGKDTVWVLGFKPNGEHANELKGTISISSDGYAIANLVARSADTILKREVRLEQQYEKVIENGVGHWFPSKLNYIIGWEQKTKTSSMKYFLKGNSQIDSVTFVPDEEFHFDKAHTVRLQPGADEIEDTGWKKLRPMALEDKELLTYKVIDSIGEHFSADRIMGCFSRLPEGKLSGGILDLDLKRVFSTNRYENYRLGLGLQTNDKWSRGLSVGGWAGYGFGDVQWKYGLFAEAYLDRHKEFMFKAGYSDDIIEPGKVKLNDEIDKNYLGYYLLSRVDHVKTYSISVKKRLGYWALEIGARSQEIMPEYNFSLFTDGVIHLNFTAREASMNFRYAYAERTAPFFDHYYSMGSKYPIVYGKVTTGILESASLAIPYTHVVAAVSWQKHINRWGNDHLLLKAGKSWSTGTLPLSKLFAGTGFKYDQSSAYSPSLYAFGGLVTMYPYGFYTDQFIQFAFRHDFDRKLYKVKFPGSALSSSPYPCLQYGLLYGTLKHPDAQQLVAFRVPDNAYHECGLMINDLLRLNYLNLYYLTLNAGYFCHVTEKISLPADGTAVIGFGVLF